MTQAEPKTLSAIVAFGHRSILALALAIFAVLYGLSINAHLSTYGDNAKYILLARGLVEDGTYSVNLDGNPRPESKHPPGFPLALVPVYWITGGSVVAMKAVAAIAAVAAVGVFYVLFKSLMTPAQSVLLLFLLGFSRHIGRFANKVMSETPFLLLLGFAMLAAQSYSRDTSWRTRSGFLTSVLLVFAAFTRTIGVVAIAAVAAFLLADHVIAAIAGSAQAIWFFRNKLVAGTVTEYFGYLSIFPSPAADSSQSAVSRLFSTVVDNVAFYLPAISRSVLSDRYPKLLPYWLLAIAVSTVVIFGLINRVKHRPSVVEWVFASLLLATLLYPPQSSRLAVPLLPFFLYYLVSGVAGVVEGWGAFRYKPLRYGFLSAGLIIVAHSISTNVIGRGSYTPLHWAMAVAVMALLVVVLYRGARLEIMSAALAVLAVAMVCSSLIWHVQRNVMRARIEPYYYQIDKSWGEYREVADWLKSHTSRDSLIVCRKPFLMRLWTGRKVTKSEATPDRDRVLEGLLRRRADFVVLDRFKFSSTTAQYLKPVIDADDTLFREVFAVGGTKVYRVDYAARDFANGPEGAGTQQ